MPTVTLPDKKELKFEKTITLLDVAKEIGSSLARAAIAGEVDGEWVDLSYLIQKDCRIRILTNKDPESLEILRHSTAHLLAHAVKELYPETQPVIGPVIENGFYYDFSTPTPFTIDDFKKIEKQMAELIKKDIPIKRIEMSRQKAIALFESKKEDYKVKVIQELAKDEMVSLYEQGDFIDLCRGPHVHTTGVLKAFKLMKVAGAYWRGDAKNEMLQRIYGTAWFSEKELKAYLHRLEEAEKRDHRRLGKAMNLFHFQEEAPGMAFWHAKGWTLYKTIINYMRGKLEEYDYEEVYAPMMADKTLWQKSGHWDKFGQEGMFITASENRDYVIKPMNCPGHIQIYKQGLKSYRQLPIRMAEFGLCHRNEPSGTLLGLMRIREFVQDDAHVYCTKEQLLEEIETLIHIVFEIYRDFGFEDILVRLATRPDKRIGEDAVWERSEKALEKALKKKAISFEWAPGEGAFYGPKIEFQLKDSLERIWQCGTIQVDFSMPERLGAQYIDEKGNAQTPIMIHRAILGSLERFIGILLENYGGWLPLWLAPIQVVILNITDHQAEYAFNLAKKLKKIGVKVKTDLRNEKIGFKIREHTLARIPYQLVVGDREVESKKVSVRYMNEKVSTTLSIAELIQKFSDEIEEKKHS